MLHCYFLGFTITIECSPTGVTIWCKRYALCMNDKRVRCARKVRQQNMFMSKLIRTPLKCFQRIYPNLFPFDCRFFFDKHITVMFRSCI